MEENENSVKRSRRKTNLKSSRFKHKKWMKEWSFFIIAYFEKRKIAMFYQKYKYYIFIYMQYAIKNLEKNKNSIRFKNH